MADMNQQTVGHILFFGSIQPTLAHILLEQGIYHFEKTAFF
jgi:hypothetical protein